MSDGVPLHYKTITEIAKLIESKQVSPVEITSYMLSRIEGLDPRFKSYATVMADSALAAARYVEQEIQVGAHRGALHGDPIAVKDLCFAKSVRTMGGTKSLIDNIPHFDATVVTKFDAAGAVLLGSSTSPKERWAATTLISKFPSTPGMPNDGRAHRRAVSASPLPLDCVLARRAATQAARSDSLPPHAESSA